MASCPNCHQTIEILNQHMGALFNCPHCRAVFFVDWNGQPEGMAEHTPEAAPTPELAPDIPVDPLSSEVPAFESPLEMPAVGNDFQASPLEMPLEMPIPEEVPPVMETPLEAPFDAPLEAPLEEEMPFETPVEAEGFTPTESVSEGMADVLNYGNQESSAGPLTYTVLIAGLELAETFESLKEALTDSRFNWEPDDVMAQMKAGRLELKGLNPTKASILINRIKYLPIEVSWKQEVYGGTS